MPPHVSLSRALPPMQTIENDPEQSDTISKTNSNKNRYLNIFTCEGTPSTSGVCGRCW